jgi:hypothetical protein
MNPEQRRQVYLSRRCLGGLVRLTSPFLNRFTPTFGVLGSCSSPVYSGGKPLDLVRRLTPASLAFRALRAVCASSDLFFLRSAMVYVVLAVATGVR